MKVEFDVNAKKLEEEIKNLLGKARESRRGYENLNIILTSIEDKLITIYPDQKKVKDFVGKKKGIFGGLLTVIIVLIILFLVILFAVMK
jgi:type III secretory pathway lipoprotein EscJ